MCGLHMIMLFWNTHRELKKSSSKNTEGHWSLTKLRVCFLKSWKISRVLILLKLYKLKTVARLNINDDKILVFDQKVLQLKKNWIKYAYNWIIQWERLFFTSKFYCEVISPSTRGQNFDQPSKVFHIAQNYQSDLKLKVRF